MPYQPAADHRSGSAHSTPAVDVDGLSAVEGGVDGVEDRSHIRGSVRHVHIGNRPPFVANGDAPVPSILVRKIDVGVQAFLRLRQIDEVVDSGVEQCRYLCDGFLMS